MDPVLAGRRLGDVLEEDDRLTKELAELRKHPDASDPTPANTLATAERLLVALRAANPDLENSIKELELAVVKTIPVRHASVA